MLVENGVPPNCHYFCNREISPAQFFAASNLVAMSCFERNESAPFTTAERRASLIGQVGQDLRPGPLPLDPPRRFEPSYAGHHHVHEDEIGLPGERA